MSGEQRLQSRLAITGQPRWLATCYTEWLVVGFGESRRPNASAKIADIAVWRACEVRNVQTRKH